MPSDRRAHAGPLGLPAAADVWSDALVTAADREPSSPDSGVQLYWLPLGAGGSVVRFNGMVYEAFAAARARRPRLAIYHAALIVEVGGERFAVELAPIRDDFGADRGVTVEGPVGARWAGRFRLFRYELRCRRGGVIPDLEYAVDSPRLLGDGAGTGQRVLGLVPHVPPLVWGRDESHAGEMWNSNSVIAWLLARAGVDPDGVAPPCGGRAPGWAAGALVARHPPEPALVGRRARVRSSGGLSEFHGGPEPQEPQP